MTLKTVEATRTEAWYDRFKKSRPPGGFAAIHHLWEERRRAADHALNESKAGAGGLMSTLINSADLARRDLDGFGGQLIGPSDPDYGAARAVHNAMIDRRPALIAKCADPADVAAAVRFATRNDLLLAVRGGGHNGAGLGSATATSS